MSMSSNAKTIMQYLADQYAAQGFGNHRVWTFSRGAGDTAFPELEGHELIKTFGTGRVEFVLTDKGQRWAMANHGATAEDGAVIDG